MKVLVTGGASGLGAALVVACRQRGDGVSVIDLALGPEADFTWFQHDMGSPDPQDWARLGAWLARLGPFDLVVQSAGISATGPFESIAPDRHLGVTGVNLAGPMQLALILQQGGLIAQGGRLVFVASLSCFTGYPGAVSYAASKDGLSAFARSLRKPLRKQGIFVQLICPGPMDTPHATRYAPEGSSGKGRIAPESVACAILRAAPRQFSVVPGAGPKLTALLGRAFPRTMTRIMGRVLFDKLRSGPRP